jgi:hypothetical protein
MEELIREALRERCAQLALQLYAGQDVACLLEDVTDLARDAWAMRDTDDN